MAEFKLYARSHADRLRQTKKNEQSSRGTKRGGAILHGGKRSLVRYRTTAHSRRRVGNARGALGLLPLSPFSLLLLLLTRDAPAAAASATKSNATENTADVTTALALTGAVLPFARPPPLQMQMGCSQSANKPVTRPEGEANANANAAASSSSNGSVMPAALAPNPPVCVTDVKPVLDAAAAGANGIAAALPTSADSAHQPPAAAVASSAMLQTSSPRPPPHHASPRAHAHAIAKHGHGPHAGHALVHTSKHRPLVVCGPSGVGKVRSACNYMRANGCAFE